MSCRKRGKAEHIKPRAKSCFFLKWRNSNATTMSGPAGHDGKKRMKRLADLLTPPSASGFLVTMAPVFCLLLFQTFPSYPLAVLRQAILGIEQPIALLARGTPRQWQSRCLAMVGSKQPGPRIETLQCARRRPRIRLVPSGAHSPRAHHAHSHSLYKAVPSHAHDDGRQAQRGYPSGC